MGGTENSQAICGFLRRFDGGFVCIGWRALTSTVAAWCLAADLDKMVTIYGKRTLVLNIAGPTPHFCGNITRNITRTYARLGEERLFFTENTCF